MVNYYYSDWIEISLSVMGDRLSGDHAYRLYSAIIGVNSRLKNIEWQMGGISGTRADDGWIKLNLESRLLIRCKLIDLNEFNDLENSTIRIGQNIIQLGQIEGRSLLPQTDLRSEIVTIKTLFKCHVSPFEFGVALGKQLHELGVSTIPSIGNRQILKIKDDIVVGYGITFTGLKAQDSIVLQVCGLGGRRRMGCGVFKHPPIGLGCTTIRPEASENP